MSWPLTGRHEVTSLVRATHRLRSRWSRGQLLPGPFTGGWVADLVRGELGEAISQTGGSGDVQETQDSMEWVQRPRDF